MIQEKHQPNMIFILIDDLGWKDLGCYGSDFYETPHLDKLATEGMQFTDAYAACPVCSPTRASILTGKYPVSVGITNFISNGKVNPMLQHKGKLIDAPYLTYLPHEEKSLATALQEGGYQTWHVGKWHLGNKEFYPEHHGFDVNIGGCNWGAPSKGYFSPYHIPTLQDGPEGEYLTDRLTDECIQLIKNRERSKPFFLNLWHYTVHKPIQCKEDLVEKYRQKKVKLGLDQMVEFEEGEPHPTEQKRHLNVQRRLIQSNPIYAAMVENLDTNIGRLLDVIKGEGIEQDTLIIFTSDNGGLSTSEDSPTCNAPLNEGKGWMYEGGVREPLIVKWPAVIQSNRICSSPVTSPDFYPTLLEAAGLDQLPEQHTDGVSFMSCLRGDNSFERGPIYWHYPHYGNQGGTPGSSIRDNAYKLIEFFEDGRLELYNLVEDIQEVNDIAKEYPKIVNRLHKLLMDWRNDNQAKLPQINPDWV